jgi:hypothetical protein
MLHRFTHAQRRPERATRFIRMPTRGLAEFPRVSDANDTGSLGPANELGVIGETLVN